MSLNSAAKPEKRKLRRGDPGRHRKLKLKVGSQEEVGRELLDVLRDEGDGHPIIYAEGSFWEYIEATTAEIRGCWAPISDEELHRIIGSFDGSEFWEGKTCKTLRVSHAFAQGAILRAAIQASAPRFFDNATPTLVFTDCAVRITEAGAVERLPHSPEHRARAGYPFDYDPNAKRERFDRMQQEHFAGDADAQEKIACIQEHLGAPLFGLATKQEKCLALPSEGGSGRSATLKIVEAAYPPGTVSHIDAKELRSAERRTRLVGKLLNFSDEVPPDSFLETEDFKKLVVGNTVTGEGKYRASFEFRFIGGLVFPMQNIASSELTTAFFRRFNIVRYNRTFEGDPSRVFGLADEIIATEIPGVVAYLIDGAARLQRQKCYTTPASHAEEILRWRSETDTVTAFVADELVRSTFDDPSDRKSGAAQTSADRHDWTQSSSLYEDYEAWCRATGHHKPVGSVKFGVRLKSIGVRFKKNEKGMFYGVRARVSAEYREKELAKREDREPRAIRGFFDEPAKLALVDTPPSGGRPDNPAACKDPDGADGSVNLPPSGQGITKPDTYKRNGALTGDRPHSTYIEREVSAEARQDAHFTAKKPNDRPDGQSVRPASQAGEGGRMSPRTLLEAALHYALDLGRPVLPLAPRAKNPITRCGLRDASMREETIRAWWHRTPNANVGVLTGGGLIVVDIDGETGRRSLAALERQHGRLPETIESRTSRGRHILYGIDGDAHTTAGTLASSAWISSSVIARVSSTHSLRAPWNSSRSSLKPAAPTSSASSRKCW
jgi:phage/plasmid-associated DNA primase